MNRDYVSIRKKILNRDIKCTALVEEYLQRIRDNMHLNAFLSIFEVRARKKAEDVDRKIRKGKAGKLAGMVVGIKDILSMRNEPTTCGSKILEHYISPYDATVIKRLEAEDAIIIGKTNMDEFGMGSSNENSAFGPVKNPYDPERIPGGSSGGSAAAVAAGMVMAALGSDTGGSVRQPAALCGIVGLRPTYGRISRYGLIAFASSLDQVGCFSNTVADCAELLQVIAGRDLKDSTSSDEKVPEYASYLHQHIKGKRIGLPKEYFGEGLGKSIKEKIDQVIAIFEKNGAEICDVSLPHTEYGIATYYLICTAEASSNLSRYDGVRFGCRDMEGKTLEAMYANSRYAGFGDEVKRRIILGTYVLSAGYYDAYYRKAQKVRTLIRQDFEKAFQSCELILSPTTPTTAFKIGEKINDPLSMYLYDVYTVTGPLAGVPGVSIPAGKDNVGLPIGVQLTGKPFAEGELLGVANWLEQYVVTEA
jgi:aspartyl-tRNA(Asn)/glutamyl-tRNA(Gln) amidotransferase subunit A